jgi:hypothetical protein
MLAATPSKASQRFRDYPLIGHVADIREPAQMTRTGYAHVQLDRVRRAQTHNPLTYLLDPSLGADHSRKPGDVRVRYGQRDSGAKSGGKRDEAK